MMRALYSGVAGLRTHQTRMDVIGNNIANVNTLAFKSSSTTFQDIMYQTTSGASGPTENLGGKNANQIGLGVTTGATKISIASGGAAESTGDATDIKLTDAQNTNFFIVNNGSQNMFTRAGSFYIDEAGNLAMTTTGFMVQGWGVNKQSMTIQQNTVGPLRVMSEDNRTSQPEATTKGTVSGILDKNTPAVDSENGYIMSLNFYDDLGYSYNAKFSLHKTDADEGEYSISLSDITDANGKTILTKSNNQAGITIDDKDYIKDAAGNNTTTLDTSNDWSSLFGNKTQRVSSYSPTSKFTSTDPAATSTGGTSTATNALWTKSTNSAGTSKYFKLDMTAPGTLVDKDGKPETDATHGSLGYVFTATDGSGDTKFFSLGEIYGVSDTAISDKAKTITNTTLKVDGANITAPLQFVGNKLVVVKDTTDYTVKFDPSDGSFSYVGETGQKSVDLNLSPLGVNFRNVNIDFSQVKTADNGAASTMGILKGDVTKTLGTGKKLGAMTGLSIAQDGKIFGSYDNGNTVLLGQIAVAQFANPSGLESVGNNCYSTTLNSGEFNGIGVEITADGGKMTTGQLEMSNVDLARQFTDMITTQRGFQANSRIITTSDTLLEELVNLKR